jgi:hypothetical protein
MATFYQETIVKGETGKVHTHVIRDIHVAILVCFR